jgi:hypothetical protein
MKSTHPIDYLEKKLENGKITVKDLFHAREIFAAEIIKAWEAGVEEQYEFQHGKFESFAVEGEFPHKANVHLSGGNYYRNNYKD